MRTGGQRDEQEQQIVELDLQIRRKEARLSTLQNQQQAAKRNECEMAGLLCCMSEMVQKVVTPDSLPAAIDSALQDQGSNDAECAFLKQVFELRNAPDYNPTAFEAMTRQMIAHFFSGTNRTPVPQTLKLMMAWLPKASRSRLRASLSMLPSESTVSRAIEAGKQRSGSMVENVQRLYDLMVLEAANIERAGGNGSLAWRLLSLGSIHQDELKIEQVSWM